MNHLNGGYIMLNLANANALKYAKTAVSAYKPILVYTDGKIPAYAKNVVVSGDSAVVIADKAYVLTSSGVTSEFTDFTKLPSALLDALEAGDVIVKTTDGDKHSYRVSYKKENTGICLTYVDASVVETVSYDYTDGAWVYNSTDSTPLTE